MRQRFKINRLCSSDNYIASKRIHRKDLVDSHNNNKAFFAELVNEKMVKTPYVRVFGKLMQISVEEASMSNITVIWL